MKQISKDGTSGFQKVVYDEVVSTIPGGKHIDKTDAAARFTNGIIPAGTLVVPGDNGMVKVLNAALTATNVKGAIGLVSHDIAIDDFPTAAIVISGTARIDALPDLEKTGIAFLNTALPRITFY